jgi:hypothetical protein
MPAVNESSGLGLSREVLDLVLSKLTTFPAHRGLVNQESPVFVWLFQAGI